MSFTLYPRRQRLLHACAASLCCGLLASGFASADIAGSSATSAQQAARAPRISAIVRAVLDDGTIAISLGTVLTPVRLSGVTLMPGAIQAIQKAAPVGAHIYVQIIDKTLPARGLVWVKNQSLNDTLVAMKLAIPKKE